MMKQEEENSSENTMTSYKFILYKKLRIGANVAYGKTWEVKRTTQKGSPNAV